MITKGILVAASAALICAFIALAVLRIWLGSRTEK
jgi:hypothetical protein